MSKWNVTVALDEETADWARLAAAARGTSISQMLADMLHEAMVNDRAYSSAMESYLSGRPRILKPGAGGPDRDSAHDRADLRR